MGGRSEQIQVISIGTGNFPFQIALESAAGGWWDWREIIKTAMFLTTDNALAQASLLLGPNKILRLEPTAEAANIELDDWKAAVEILPDIAKSHFQQEKSQLSLFFKNDVRARERFYTS